MDKFYVISDFGTLADFLENDEIAELKKEYEFINKEECRRFIYKILKSEGKRQSNIKLPKEIL